MKGAKEEPSLKHSKKEAGANSLERREKRSLSLRREW